MKVVNPDNPPGAVERETLRALAKRQVRASGILMHAINAAGTQVEDGLKILPAPLREGIETSARNALAQSYDLAAKSRSGLGHVVRGDGAHRALGTLSGALGGLGGLPTALVEIPVTTTLIFRAVQGVAQAHGENPLDAAVRVECLRVFGSGGPGGLDDGVDTAFLGARLSLTGPALNALIRQIAPRFALVLSQKLAAQTVPILGAAAGAGVNYAFLRYYSEMAHVHFGLRQMARRFDPEMVSESFHAELAKLRAPNLRKGKAGG